MSNPDPLLVGLAGGAIGGVVTGLFAQAGRAWRAWGEVALHDVEAEERNAQLLVWVDDRTRALDGELKRRTGDANSKGVFHSGAHGLSRAMAKAQALHDYRDEEWQARLELARLRSREGGWHWIWRKLRRRPAAHLTVQERIEPFLDRWREPVTKHLSQCEGEGVVPVDRTRRTYDDALAELPSFDLD